MKTIQTAIRLTPEQKARLENTAELQGITPSELIRRMIDFYDNRRNKQVVFRAEILRLGRTMKEYVYGCYVWYDTPTVRIHKIIDNRGNEYDIDPLTLEQL